MVDNIVKPLGLVLIATAQMVFNGPSKAEVNGTVRMTGTLGNNITLTFTFSNTPLASDSYIAVYKSGLKKIAESNSRSGKGVFKVDPESASVLYHITNLQQNDSETYWASLLFLTPPKESNRVQLDVREENRTSTVPPVPTNATKIGDNGTSSFFHIVTVLVVSPVVLLAALLPWLIWCLLRTKDKQQQPQQNSTPTVQETVASNTVPPPSLIYSVLDFSKRPSAVLEINPNDTEYAAVSYFPESM